MNVKLLFVLLGVLIVNQLSTAHKNSGNSGNYGFNGQNGQVVEKTVIVTKTQENNPGYGNEMTNVNTYSEKTNVQSNPGYNSKNLIIISAFKQVLRFIFLNKIIMVDMERSNFGLQKTSGDQQKQYGNDIMDILSIKYK